ncbi:MAG: STAS domain-containing protein [Erysipelotrichaceae bacterium]|nr:STAS domain-containing protein [Erysipelotrichaceae bacterium]
MNVEVNRDGNILTIKISGRLDTVSCGQLEQQIAAVFDDDIGQVILDLDGLEYVVSSGLRILLRLYRRLAMNGSLLLVNVSDYVYEILEMTGFAEMLAIERKTL